MQDVLKPRVDESTLGSRARVCCCCGGGVGCCFSDLSVSFCDEAGAVTGETDSLPFNLSAKKKDSENTNVEESICEKGKQ